ncbi:MAG: alpha/beta hydrolase [Eggerthellaceae bacterium]
MPFNFAFFDINAADRVRADFPDVGTWWVGGHSLGGRWRRSTRSTMPATARSTARAVGILLPATCRARTWAISLYGSNDQVLNRAKLEDTPTAAQGAETVEIEGGNHAGFGAYARKAAMAKPASPRGTAEPNRRRHRPLHQARYAEPSWQPQHSANHAQPSRL